MRKKDLFLTNELRKELKKPIGKLIEGDEKEASRELVKELEDKNYRKLIFVGDYLINSYAAQTLDPDIQIYDGRVGRNTHVETRKPTKTIENPPGSIKKDVWLKLKEVLKSNEKERLFVEGEEDLLVLPASKLSKKNNIVVYGFFNKGLCYIQSKKFNEDKYLRRMKKGKFKNVTLGGTFDRLHSGHKFFLRMGEKYGKNLIIGLSSQKMCENKELSGKIQDYNTRKKELRKFLESLETDYEIVKINDIYGPAKERKDVRAIVITNETLENAKKINKKRKKKGLPELNYFILPYILDENGEKLSSTNIRKGKINRKGKALN